MIAAYPPTGSHYILHVDNPNRDGRVITAIYYLNLHWDALRSGGSLRYFTFSYDNYRMYMHFFFKYFTFMTFMTFLSAKFHKLFIISTKSVSLSYCVNKQ